jgi:alpha-glucosidase
LRRNKPCLVEGDYQPVRARNEILSYRRSLGKAAISVGLNTTGEPRRWDLGEGGERLISTYLDRPRESVEGSILLRVNEGILVEHG